MLEKRKREEQADKVRNEGLETVKNKDKNEEAIGEVDLEIEAPGAASKVAEEGSKVILD